MNMIKVEDLQKDDYVEVPGKIYLTEKVGTMYQTVLRLEKLTENSFVVIFPTGRSKPLPKGYVFKKVLESVSIIPTNTPLVPRVKATTVNGVSID